MKTASLIILSAIIFTVTANAQINKGQWLAGGDAMFSHQKESFSTNGYNDNTTITNIGLSPIAGYFIIDKLVIGLSPNLVISRLTASYPPPQAGDVIHSTTIGLSPFVRYYFLPAANKINVLAQASYDYSKWKETEGGLSGSAVGEQVRKGYTLAAGPACMLARHVSLEVLAKYNYYKYLEVKDSFIILAAGFQIHLGKGSTGK